MREKRGRTKKKGKRGKKREGDEFRGVGERGY